jgi:hypothetical protein
LVSAYGLPPKDDSLLQDVAVAAYKFNQEVKSMFLLEDLWVTSCKAQDRFEPARMEIEANKEGQPGNVSQIVACVGLGLESRVTYGTMDDMKRKVKEKLTALTDAFLEDLN